MYLDVERAPRLWCEQKKENPQMREMPSPKTRCLVGCWLRARRHKPSHRSCGQLPLGAPQEPWLTAFGKIMPVKYRADRKPFIHFIGMIVHTFVSTGEVDSLLLLYIYFSPIGQFVLSLSSYYSRLVAYRREVKARDNFTFTCKRKWGH